MANFYDHIPEAQQAFINKQHMFFVATAPMNEEGHVNLSPKGQDTFRIVDQNTVAYLDLTGSGNETSAHILENGRLTFMFCAFEGPPNILRLYGQGRVVLPTSDEWSQLSRMYEEIPGTRQIIVCDVHKVQTSCGYAVPKYEYVDDRDQLRRYAVNKGEEGMAQYRHDKNLCSMDGMPTHLAQETAK